MRVDADRFARLIERDPLRPGRRSVLVKEHAEVERGAHADATQRLNLLAQQVQSAQSGMAFAALRVVVQLPVMALGEEGHGVHLETGETFGEFGRIEFSAHVGDVRRRVEVEVHGPAGHNRPIGNGCASMHAVHPSSSVPVRALPPKHRMFLFVKIHCSP